MSDPMTTRMPQAPGIDYSQRSPRVTGHAPQIRAHESVLVQPQRSLPIADMARRCREGDNGGEALQGIIQDLQGRRLDAARRRRNGESVRDLDAEALSFATIGSVKELQRALDFDVNVQVPTQNGGQRSVTTSAFNLLTSALAFTDVTVAGESVPTVADMLVTDIDDVQPNTEIPEALDFGFTDPADEPVALGETQEYREVGVGEDRYTLLNYKDGYQRAFSQQLLDQVSGSRVASELMDLGRGAMEVMELFALRKIIDYNGSAASGSKHVMIRNRAAAALFSATANTPSTRTPDGTRIENNALEDVTDLENARARLAGMRNSRNYPMPNQMRKILVPDALWLRAWTILHSLGTPGVFNEVNFFGPGGPAGGQLISTPMLDLLTTSAWYAGDPQRQFLRKWRRRPEVAVFGGVGTEPYLRTHEGMRVRIGWDMTVGVRAHVHWVENLAATTAPKDA